MSMLEAMAIVMIDSEVVENLFDFTNVGTNDNTELDFVWPQNKTCLWMWVYENPVLKTRYLLQPKLGPKQSASK